jgi:oxygen-independent coproporphyrinogen-3 oxidase
MPPLVLYIHWPYCASKCPYCDFNSRAAKDIDHEAWAGAYAREIEYYARLLPERRIASIYFGGGTPSLMAAETVESVLQNIQAHWPLTDDVEITLEANPSSAEAGKFAAFRAAGVNRLSLGVQSLRDDALKFLGRAHDAESARRALEQAAKIFPRFSFDLIYARAGQNPSDWAAELREALRFAPRHLSVYQLTIEPGTRFHAMAEKGASLTAPEDNAAVMYEMTQEILGSNGLPAYEISNHAAPGEASRHNLAYWHYADYIGIGPGAHGRLVKGGVRYATENHREPDEWLRQVAEQGHGQRVFETLDTATAQREALMMGLRLTAGIDSAAWQAKFGILVTDFLLPEKLKRLCDEGLLIADAANFRATAHGLQRLNAVLGYLMG